MQSEDPDERSIRLAAIARSIEMGTYWVPAEEIAAAIMAGPFGAFVAGAGLPDLGSPEAAEDDNAG